jgi:hypothetical protein
MKGTKIMRPHLGIATLVVSYVFVHSEGSVSAAGGSVVQASPIDQQMIVWNFNFERCLVNPPAKTMKAIQWDSGLATGAANMAQSCTYTGTNVNQSAVLDTAATITFGAALNYTRSTLANDYDYYKNLSKSGAYDVRPYKQMILATQTKVGCAQAACPAGIYDTINKKPLIAPNGQLNRSWVVCKYSDDAGHDRPYTQGSYGDANDACPQVFAGKMKIAAKNLPKKMPCVSYLKAEECSTSGDTFLVTRSADASGAAVYQIFNTTRKMCLTADQYGNVTYGSCFDQVAKFKIGKRNSPYMAFSSAASGRCVQMVPGAYGSTSFTAQTCKNDELQQQFTFTR